MSGVRLILADIEEAAANMQRTLTSCALGLDEGVCLDLPETTYRRKRSEEGCDMHRTISHRGDCSIENVIGYRG